MRCVGGMMPMARALLVSLLFLISAQAVVIPTTLGQIGWELGTAGSGMRVDFFGDFSCPDTAAAWNTVIKPLLAKYSAQVSIVFHPYPLPYHHNSFDASQAAHVMVDHLHASGMLLGDVAPKVLDAMFSAQSTFESWQTPNPTANMTQVQVIQNLFAPIAVAAGMPRKAFLETMGTGWNVTPNGPFVTARTAWKYGAALGVSATPTFAANGALSDDLSDWKLDDWKKWLAAGLPQTSAQVHV